MDNKDDASISAEAHSHLDKCGIFDEATPILAKAYIDVSTT